jgi:hypothetical protein
MFVCVHYAHQNDPSAGTCTFLFEATGGMYRAKPDDRALDRATIRGDVWQCPPQFGRRLKYGCTCNVVRSAVPDRQTGAKDATTCSSNREQLDTSKVEWMYYAIYAWGQRHTPWKVKQTPLGSMSSRKIESDVMFQVVRICRNLRKQGKQRETRYK